MKPHDLVLALLALVLYRRVNPILLGRGRRMVCGWLIGKETVLPHSGKSAKKTRLRA
jgi:hypothetical protein